MAIKVVSLPVVTIQMMAMQMVTLQVVTLQVVTLQVVILQVGCTATDCLRMCFANKILTIKIEYQLHSLTLPYHYYQGVTLYLTR